MPAPAALQHWLESRQGRLSIGPRGLLIGRGPGVDLSLPDGPARCALVYLDGDEAWLVALSPLLLNGRRIGGEQPGPHPLSDGDALQAGSLLLRYRARPAAPRREPSGWFLRLGGRGFRPLPSEGASLGGGPGDTIPLSGWPPGALRLEPEPGGPRALLAEGFTLNGRPVPPGELRLSSGDRLARDGLEVQLLELGSRPGTAEPPAGPPDKLVLKPLPPAGGRLTVERSGEQRSAFLPEPHFGLLRSLLQPQDEGAASPPLPLRGKAEGTSEPDGPPPELLDLGSRLQRAGLDTSWLVLDTHRAHVALDERTTVVFLKPC